jgi:hypothetical protein
VEGLNNVLKNIEKFLGRTSTAHAQRQQLDNP